MQKELFKITQNIANRLPSCMPALVIQSTVILVLSCWLRRGHITHLLQRYLQITTVLYRLHDISGFLFPFPVYPSLIQARFW